MLPTFIGIGAPKAATTWLFQCLREHPDTFVAAVKETEYFAWRYERTDVSEYAAHFSEADDTRAVGEISTSYLNDPKAPLRVHNLLPDVRLFASLRDPVDQVYSHFWHLQRQNFHQAAHERPGTFEEALELHTEKLLDAACYHKHLTRWLMHFDHSQLHVILYDDICKQPEAVLHELFEFLGVAPDFRPQALEMQSASTRRGTSPRGPLLERLYNMLYDSLNRIAYAPIKRLVGSYQAEQLKNKLRVREAMELILRRQGYPEMDPDTRRRLRGYFASDVRALEDLIGRNLDHWT